MSYGFPKKKAPETFILRLSTAYGLTLPWTDLNEPDKISRAVCDTASVYRVLPKMVQYVVRGSPFYSYWRTLAGGSQVHFRRDNMRACPCEEKDSDIEDGSIGERVCTFQLCHPRESRRSKERYAAMMVLLINVLQNNGHTRMSE